MSKIIDVINSDTLYNYRWVDHKDIIYEIQLYNNQQSNLMHSGCNDIGMFASLRFRDVSIHNNEYEDGKTYYNVIFWVYIDDFLEDMKEIYES